jgi:tetratricopeptide (TPR) repeat protein
MMPKAREAALKALSLDNNLAEAHTALGLVLATFDFDVEAGEREYKRAIELDPNYGTAHQWYAELLYFLGRFDEAEKHIDLALKTDPLSPVFNRVKGIMYQNQRRFREAEEQEKKTIALDPSIPGSYYDLSEIYFITGRDKEAVEYYSKYMEVFGDRGAADRIRKAFAENGRTGALNAIIENELATTKNNYAIAKHYALLGEKDQVFSALEKAFTERTFQVLQIGVDPGLDVVRDDPRYRELAKRLNLPGPPKGDR